MNQLAKRAETIAAHLVGRILDAEATKFDTEGRQAAVDFMLTWADGRFGALEVTLVTEPESSKWQGQAVSDGWVWPAPTSWEFRLSGPGMRYRDIQKSVLRVVELCDQWNVEGPGSLPQSVLDHEPDVEALAMVGTLRRTPFSPGVTILPDVRVEFLDASPPDFGSVVEQWAGLPHMPRHVEKLHLTEGVAERHLFLVPVDEVLPSRFFTHDFPTPNHAPSGYEGLDGLWVWSNYWRQFLSFRSGLWQWHDLPAS